ncbi:hypothetical protein BJF79_03800 [Actinomadura sp. CNU-125]|uniref:hypothetical protein n=1 Tax=Actinomadura sp. CNU-125 TaxID=1904961 RepID=UPI000966FA76|nr:hypothetical protein [Actinomadura sp. CNU-125]OLT13033.1 hypothetical protein BJF79_03800 [Actinomadura sp. CNU-125]
MSDEMHDCARGIHCAARTTTIEDGERITIPAQTYRTFCDVDRDRIADVLTDLPARYAELAARIGERRRSDGPRVSGGGRTAPIPINTAVDALLRTVEEIVLSWDERVRDVARLTDLTAANRAAAIPVACGMLAAHVDVLLTLDPETMARTMDLAHIEHLPEDVSGWVRSGGWVLYNVDLGAEHAGVELLNLHHRTLKMLGYTPQHHPLITPCWECGERGLRRHDGTAGLADHVECLNCREQYLGGRLNRLMVEEDEAQQRKADRERRHDPKRHSLAGAREGTGGRR